MGRPPAGLQGSWFGWPVTKELQAPGVQGCQQSEASHVLPRKELSRPQHLCRCPQACPGTPQPHPSWSCAVWVWSVPFPCPCLHQLADLQALQQEGKHQAVKCGLQGVQGPQGPPVPQCWAQLLYWLPWVRCMNDWVGFSGLWYMLHLLFMLYHVLFFLFIYIYVNIWHIKYSSSIKHAKNKCSFQFMCFFFFFSIYTPFVNV